MDLTIAKNAKIHTRGHYKVTGLDNPGLDIDAKTGDQNNTEPIANGEKPKVEIEIDEEERFIYDVFDNPPIPLTFGFAIQHGLLSLSRSLSTSLLVADILCARADEALKAKLLSTTMFMSGLCTFLQNTIGIRLPLYQGPTATYVTPLIALMALPAWSCVEDGDNAGAVNGTTNGTVVEAISTLTKIQRLEGSLMIAGALHMFVGMFGIVGLLLRFIGPITVVPALTLMALYVFSATVRFAKAQWGIAALTVAVALILSFYLAKRRTPIPWYNRSRGFHIKWSQFHKMFSILIATIVGWVVSWIITEAGGFDMSPDSDDFYARTDSRTFIIDDTKWFIFPYPGQFGHPRYETGAFITFLIGTLGSIIDSIGDYYACVKVIEAPPPPRHAVNRGIAVEGFMSFIAGWAGAGHATSTFGGNIGAIGITKVASLRVFQLLGLLFMVLGVIGKVGAFFVTIPYSVIGGLQVINFGVLAGVMLSNLQFIDLNSKRNLSVIGISMLIAMMLQHWIKTTKDAIETGIEDLDNTITMLLGNPVFMAGVLACFFDNTMPGTREERGLTAWQEELKGGEDESSIDKIPIAEEIRLKKIRKTVYVVPYFNRVLRR
ncbi:solute carrier family 23 member 1-like, partial [Ruditapes philippinarum]|uniref:solute carrier family 23 member 1-like n=1 Tax=Ruditapes philippinarum TaxID=129788 RepID=UPI00295AD004